MHDNHAETHRQYSQIRSLFQKLCQHGGMSFVSRLKQRRATITAHRIYEGTILQQNLANFIDFIKIELNRNTYRLYQNFHFFQFKKTNKEVMVLRARL